MTIVEIRDESGVITSRLQVEDQVFAVGRSPDCPVVVEDQFVDGHHLTVTVLEDGSGTMIEDTGTRNGTRAGDDRLLGETGRVPFGTPIVLGRTTIHLRDPDAPVAEAQALPANDGRLVDYTRIPAWSAAGVAIAMMTLWTGSSMYAPLGGAEGVGLLIGMVGLFLLWTGFWAGISRLFARQARFRTHLGFAATCALVMVPVSIPLGWLVFAADHPAVDFVVNWTILGLVMWTVVLYGHIDIASRRGHRFKLAFASLLSVSILGLAWGFNDMEGTPVDQVQRSLFVLAPIPDNLTRKSSLEDFMGEIDGIRLDAERDIEQAARD